MTSGGGANQVAVAYCHADKVDAFFHDCMTRLIMHDRDTTRRIATIHSYQTGPTLSLAREFIARQFLDEDHGVPWLLFLDTDMAFGPGLIEALLAVSNPAKAPVVGGLCFTCDRNGGQIMPTMFRRGDDGSYNCVTDYPPDELVPVDQTGAACLFIHRSVLKALDHGDGPLRFFGEMVVDNKLCSEDRAFCHRVRQAEFPIYVHTGIELGHIKPRIVAQDEYLAARSGA